MFEKTKSEDYMGMINWSKTSGSSRALFGTQIETQDPIKLEICHAEECRDLSSNWYFPKKQIIEVEMSPIQWAEFLTSGNTSGVPCTIKYLNREKMSEPHPSTIIEDYNYEVEEHFDEFGKSFDKVAETLKDVAQQRTRRSGCGCPWSRPRRAARSHRTPRSLPWQS